MKPGEELELTLERLADKGRSSVVVDGRDVLVAGAIPGDRVRAQIVFRKGRRVEARAVEVLEPSPLRAEPRCRFFGDCGGCRWQNLLYAAQLDRKREMVIEAFADASVPLDLDVPAVLGADETYNYRNKMEFSFGSRRWLTAGEIATGEDFDKRFALGMYVPGRYDRIIDLTECHLPPESADRVKNLVRDVAKERGWTPWDTKSNQGFLRHLVIRTPAHDERVLVNLVTSEFDRDAMEALASRLRAELPEVSTLVNTINTGVAQVSYGETAYTLFGEGVVHDRIGDLTFEIGPQTFFQTNTVQAERLYEIARDAAAIERDDVVYDLFCGIGAITLYVAGDAQRVVGVELDRAAVDAARRNAVANEVDNVSFVMADLGKNFSDADWDIAPAKPDVVILDPPRAGVHKKVIHWLRDVKPRRIVYVSCNPVTQARDIAALFGYRVAAMQPVDLFPHTDHIENVALLVRGR